MEGLLPVIIPLVTAIFGSIITAGLLRRSSKEANDTNAFKIVTDQLFALNKSLSDKVASLEGEVTTLTKADKDKEARIETLEGALDTSKKVSRSLAGYISLLIRRWPGTDAPPVPDPPFDWEKHL